MHLAAAAGAVHFTWQQRCTTASNIESHRQQQWADCANACCSARPLHNSWQALLLPPIFQAAAAAVVLLFYTWRGPRAVATGMARSSRADT
jgi:hypothetical protein